jgi:hypothetical protein
MTNDQRKFFDRHYSEIEALFRQDDPQITVLEEGPGSLVKILVEFTPEQTERFKTYPDFGLRVPFD